MFEAALHRLTVVGAVCLALLACGADQAPAPAPAPVPACAMAAADAAWVARAMAAWDFVERNRLKLDPAARPTLVVFDATCRYLAAPDGAVRWKGSPHKGEIALPNGQSVPAGVVSFAAPGGDGADGFFVMALPSVWRAEKVESGLGLETMMEAVWVHEFTHTRQFYFATPNMNRLSRTYGLPDDLNDDSLQDHFASNPAYVAAYQAERDLLFAAALEPDLGKSRAIAAQALTLAKERRARWFTGAEAKWAPLDDLFMTMEGMGQWAGFAWLTDRRGHGLDPATALNEFRRGGKKWTQDEGLALYLVIDKLSPGWQAKAFAAQPALAYDLLEQAVRRPRPEVV